jgi:hypothetical protein
MVSRELTEKELRPVVTKLVEEQKKVVSSNPTTTEESIKKFRLKPGRTVRIYRKGNHDWVQSMNRMVGKLATIESVRPLPNAPGSVCFTLEGSDYTWYVDCLRTYRSFSPQRKFIPLNRKKK